MVVSNDQMPNTPALTSIYGEPISQYFSKRVSTDDTVRIISDGLSSKKQERHRKGKALTAHYLISNAANVVI